MENFFDPASRAPCGKNFMFEISRFLGKKKKRKYKAGQPSELSRSTVSQ